MSTPDVKIYRVVFLTGPALKVLSVEDGKIPTKKVKVHGKFLCDTFAFTFLVGILPSSTLRFKIDRKRPQTENSIIINIAYPPGPSAGV